MGLTDPIDRYSPKFWRAHSMVSAQSYGPDQPYQPIFTQVLVGPLDGLGTILWARLTLLTDIHPSSGGPTRWSRHNPVGPTDLIDRYSPKFWWAPLMASAPTSRACSMTSTNTHSHTTVGPLDGLGVIASALIPWA